MVLADLGKSINNAFKSLSSKPNIDQETFNLFMSEICRALLSNDIHVKLVKQLRLNILASINLQSIPIATNKQKLIHNAVFNELCKLVDPQVLPFKPIKNKSNVVMFVGLQGSGKTTTCTKFAHYYMKKGWKVAIVCADTFRAGAFDQLKQNAVKAKIPFYGSYTEKDPVVLAKQGMQKFLDEKFELIIIDTSGRHKQETDLFQEMAQIEQVCQPDHVIFIVDAAIGQSAEDQAMAFKSTVNLGSIIITKMDGHAKGGGALSSVAATNCPILFIGTGEHIYDLDLFRPKSFVSQMLGMGDISGLIETVKDLKIEENTDLMKNLEKGEFTLRNLYEQLETMMKMGPIGKMMGMIPGFNSEMFKGSENDISSRLKIWMTILDSMNSKELDGNGKIFNIQSNRKLRVALGSGTSLPEVDIVLMQYKQFAAMIKKMGNSGMMKGMMSDQPMNSGQMAKMTQQMSSMMNPQVLKQMGGSSGFGNLMKQFNEMNKK